jgi:hypothetical protein
LIENKRVEASGIIEGPISDCVRRCRGKKRILAIQDTTSVEVKSLELRDALAEEGSPTGWHSHVALAVDPELRMPIGILAQENWIREPQSERRRKGRSGDEKESARWQRTASAIRERFAGSETEVVTVADREADIYELLAWHAQVGQSYVLRARHARKVSGNDPLVTTMHEAVAQTKPLGRRQVQVTQRGGQRGGGGQKARAARAQKTLSTEVRACSLTIRRPEHADAALPESLPVTVVEVRSPEVDAKGKPLLHWVLLSSEPVSSFKQACDIIETYECRWLIEELFRGWKTGFRLEERPLQSTAAVERMMAILLPMAVEILALRVLGSAGKQGTMPDCTVALEQDQWRCLWRLTEEKKRIPRKPPSCKWAYGALGKLGGFYDSARTGRIGWSTLWQGLLRLNDAVAGFRAAKTL